MLINRACPLGVEHKEEIIKKMLMETYNELPMP